MKHTARAIFSRDPSAFMIGRAAYEYTRSFGFSWWFSVRSGIDAWWSWKRR